MVGRKDDNKKREVKLKRKQKVREMPDASKSKRKAEMIEIIRDQERKC